jgi:hypothetical protein
MCTRTTTGAVTSSARRENDYVCHFSNQRQYAAHASTRRHRCAVAEVELTDNPFPSNVHPDCAHIRLQHARWFAAVTGPAASLQEAMRLLRVSRCILRVTGQHTLHNSCCRRAKQRKITSAWVHRRQTARQCTRRRINRWPLQMSQVASCMLVSAYLTMQHM